MTWVKFEDRFPWHRKVRGLSDPAFRLHVSGVCWSVEHLTDGRITADELPLVSDVKKPAQAVSELERKGLWDVLKDGWEIHDFLTYNESRAVVLARREADAERKRRGRDGRTPPVRPAGVRPDSVEDSGRTDPARPEPTKNNTAPDGADDFDEFWKLYPRKTAKPNALKAWRRARKTTSAEEILTVVERYAKERAGKDPTFTAHPASWLNARRWEDEPDPLMDGVSADGFTVNGTDPHDEWGFD